MDDRCIICGTIIPEGRQVCPYCEHVTYYEREPKERRKSMGIDWKRKLTSRKFWVALCNFIGMLVMAFGYSEGTADRITALVLAGGTCIAYIIGEGLVDAANAGVVDYYEEDIPPDDVDDE